LEEILEPIGMLSHTQFGSQNMEKRAMEIALQVSKSIFYDVCVERTPDET
jgi:hypothetical protein